jgi:hypothetical protein
MWMAYASTALVFAIKPTLCVPLVLLFVLHRRYRPLLLAIGTNVVLNIIGFLRYGGFAAVTAYRAGTATLEVRGGVNTPDFWERVSIPRVDWTYLGTGLTGNFNFARVVALLVGGALCLFLLLACLRTAQPPSLVDSCRIMLAGTFVGLVMAYHHHYDLTMLIPGLLLAFLLRRELGLTWNRWVTWSFAPLVLMMLFLPVGWTPNQAFRLIGDRGPGLFNVTFPLATTFGLAGSLALVAAASGTVADWKAWLAMPRRLRVSRSPAL